MDHNSRILVTGVVGVLMAPWGRSADGEHLAGKVFDARRQPVAGAMVVVIDAETGLPIDRETFQPISSPPHGNLATATTEASGSFSIENAKSGTYRLLAQSWEDASKPVTAPLDVHGSVVRVHGWTDRVRVPSPASMVLEIHPRGSATLDITTNPKSPNNDTLLLVSLHPLAADGILGFAAWSGPFLPNMISFNRMPLGRTNIHGLPSGAVYLAAFANDNNPGFGGAEAILVEEETRSVALPLVASWSDGYTTPPQRLAAMVNHFRSLPPGSVRKRIEARFPDFAKAMTQKAVHPMDRYLAVVPFLDRPFELETGEQVPLKDAMAADGYAQLIRLKEERVERQRNERMKQLGIEPSPNVNHEQAFRDLYETLGKTYPCFELKQIDWPGVGKRLLPRAADVTSDADFGLLCLELLAALEDSHAQLLPAAAELPPIPLPQWCAGFACLMDDREEPVVYFVAPGSPAEKAGLKVGMTILSINEKPANAAVEEFSRELRRFVGYSSDRLLRHDAVRLFSRRMESGSKLDLEVVDTTERRQTLTMVATKRGGYIPRLPVTIQGAGESDSVNWKKWADDMGYIYVRRIDDKLIESLDAALKDLKGAQGLILDVRGNSGGGFNAERAHLNFDSNQKAEPERPRYVGNIAILLDARCISAGEGWISWFVGKPNVRMFGATTAGASSRKTTYTLKNGLYAARYPVKAYTGFLDRPIERRGIEPDFAVVQTATDLVAGTDTVLEAARSYLANLRSPE